LSISSSRRRLPGIRSTRDVALNNGCDSRFWMKFFTELVTHGFIYITRQLYEE